MSLHLWKHSLRYYNMDFRNLIHSKLTNPRLHLGLVLYDYKQITDEGIKHLSRIHTINLKYCYKITDKGTRHLANVKTLVR